MGCICPTPVQGRDTWLIWLLNCAPFPRFLFWCILVLSMHIHSIYRIIILIILESLYSPKNKRNLTQLRWSLSKNDTHNRREANLFFCFCPGQVVRYNHFGSPWCPKLRKLPEIAFCRHGVHVKRFESCYPVPPPWSDRTSQRIGCFPPQTANRQFLLPVLGWK